MTIHDSFFCLAPQATRFNEIILEQLARLYTGDPLAELRQRNVSDPDLLPLPDYGLLIRFQDHSWSHRLLIRPDLIRGARNAFN
jgi:hypothetical protein